MNASRQLVQLAMAFAVILSSVAAKDLPYIQARVYFDSAMEMEQIRAMHPDIVLQREDYLEIVGFQDKLNEIASAGFRIEIIHDDLTAFYQSRLDKTRDMGGYKTLSEILAHSNQVVTDHPEIAAVVNIGSSLEGRDMWAVKVSDNVETDEDEPEVLLTGAIHAREVITPEIIVATIDLLTDGYGIDPLMTALVDNREIWFIPVINVDGYYYNEVIEPEGGGMWRKNRRNNGDGTRGVDLNRNFGYMWGYDDVGSSPIASDDNYRGTGPFSEPEVQNIRDFAIAHNFELAIHFHSYGRLIGPPWFYDYILTPDESIYSRLASVMTSLSGYDYLHLHGTMNGCKDDWDYGEQTLKNKCLSMAIEVGDYIDGFWPSLERIPVLLDLNIPMCLFVAGVAGRVDDNFEDPPYQPVINLDATVKSIEYEVAWDLTEDPGNPIAAYELREYSFEYGTTDNGGHLYSYEVQEYSESTARYYSEPSCYHSGERSNSIFYMQTILPYEVKPGDILEFRTYYDIQQHYDYAYVEVSTDGVDFTPIQGNISSTSNPNGLNRGYGITGSPGEWRDALFDLSAYVGQEIYYRFSYYTDPYSSGEGIYIDDISPISIFLSENIISSIHDKYYTLSDKEPGDYAYQVRALDLDNQWGQPSEFAATSVRAPFVCADTDGDELVNILDIVYLINYIYKNGPAPEPLISADVNHDGNINILDIVLLINYIYKNGIEPVCEI